MRKWCCPRWGAMPPGASNPIEPGGGVYRIQVRERVDGYWTAWLEGMTIEYGTDGSTILTGSVPDQSALHGLLCKIRDMQLTLLSLQRLDAEISV